MSLNFPVQMIKDTPDGGGEQLTVQAEWPVSEDFSTVNYFTATIDLNETNTYNQSPPADSGTPNQAVFRLTFNGASWDFLYGTYYLALNDTFASSNTDPADPTGTYTITSAINSVYIGETITITAV